MQKLSIEIKGIFLEFSYFFFKVSYILMSVDACF